jgi:hypothetical protein
MPGVKEDGGRLFVKWLALPVPGCWLRSRRPVGLRARDEGLLSKGAEPLSFARQPTPSRQRVGRPARPVRRRGRPRSHTRLPIIVTNTTNKR